MGTGAAREVVSAVWEPEGILGQTGDESSRLSTSAVEKVHRVAKKRRVWESIMVCSLPVLQTVCKMLGAGGKTAQGQR